MTALALVKSRAEWAAEITAAWRSSAEGILNCGQLLIASKGKLPHGEFTAMIEKDLPFGASAVQKLMKIGRNELLSKAEHILLLPPSWGTLYEIAKLDGSEVAALIDEGRIHPEMKRSDITQYLKRGRREARERRLGKAQRLAGEYGVIYADPPWRFEPYSRDSGMDRAADNHYPTMTLEDIVNMKVPAAEDCVLFMWATVPMLKGALIVMEAWGFDYKSHFVWVKDHAGTGYWSRNSHELLLVGTHGNIPAPAPGQQYDSVITAAAGEHSAKPFAFREAIEDMFPTLPRLEMFARQSWDGWDSWGNEVTDAA